MKTPKLVKPLVKDYKSAVSCLVKQLDIELKYTKTGSLSSESVGYLKGYYRLPITSDLSDVLCAMVDELGYSVSGTEVALYFRNEREEIKNESQRISVVSSVSAALGFVLVEGVSSESVVDAVDVVEENAEESQWEWDINMSVDEYYETFYPDQPKPLPMSEWHPGVFKKLGITPDGKSLLPHVPTALEKRPPANGFGKK